MTAFPNLTAEQRYNQAIRKVRIAAARELQKFEAGKSNFLPGNTLNREKAAIIAEMARAYDAGYRDGHAKDLEGST
jgi:hypothetical protein